MAALAKKAFVHLQDLCMLHQFLDWEVLLIVTRALVTFHVDYYNALYTGLSLKSFQRLQLVQNAIAQVTNNASCIVFHSFHPLKSLPPTGEECSGASS